MAKDRENPSDLCSELGLDKLEVSFDRTVGWIGVPELLRIPDDIRSLVKSHPVPSNTNHVYVTVRGNKDGIDCYDLMCRHREGDLGDRWETDEFLDLYERLKV